MAIDLNFVNDQLKHLKNLQNQNKQYNTIFEQTMSQMLEDAPIEHKKEVLEVQNIANEAFRLAKEGKVNEAIELTNKLSNKYKNER